MKNLSTSALVLATAALFSGAALADDQPTTTQGAVKCSGINACKGQSACATATNSCKGQNSCKGKGYNTTSAKECAEKGGKEIK